MAREEIREATSGVRYRLGRAGRLIGARAVALVERGAADDVAVRVSWELSEEDAASLGRSVGWLDEALAANRPLVRFDNQRDASEIAIAPLRGRTLVWARIHPPALLTDDHLELLRELADAAWEIDRLERNGGPASPASAGASPESASGAGAERATGCPEEFASALAGPVLADRSTLGTYLIQDGRLLHVNATIARRLGYEPKALIGRDALHVVHPADRSHVLRQMEDRLSGRADRVIYTFRALSAAGEVVHLEAHGAALEVRGRPALGGVLVDVSSRTRALEALQASESRFARIIALSRDATLHLDPDGTVVLFNDAAESLFGQSARDILGRTLDELSPDVAAVVSCGAEDEPGVPRSARVRRQDGTTFWAEVWAAGGGAGSEDGGLRTVMVRDVTEQRHHEQARDRLLRLERDERYRAEVAHMRAAFLDDFTGDLTTVAPEAGAIVERLAQLAVPVAGDYAVAYRLRDDASPAVAAAATISATRDAVLSDPVEPPALDWRDHPGGWLCTADPDDDVPGEVRAFFEHHARQHEARALQLLPLGDGERTVGLLVLAHTFHMAASELPATALLGRDLAARASMALAHARLYQNARTAAGLRDQVLAVVSHDLRNPLNVIAFTTDSLLRHWPSDPAEMGAVRRQVGVMRRSAERARRLVRDLLDFAQIEAGTLAVDAVRCDTGALLREALETHRPLAADRALRLELLAPDPLPAILADPERVLQVLGNLLDNAIRHTPPERAVRIRAGAEDQAVRIDVADEGPGVASDDRERIFDRFSRGRGGSKVGAGLGLAIARGIVEAHSGAIAVTSPEGAGATFSFTLPLAD